MSLRDYFLSVSQTQVLIERVKNKDAIKKEIQEWISSKDSEIKHLRKESRHGKQLGKYKLEKLEKHFKISRISSSPIAQKLLSYFIDEEATEKESRVKITAMRKLDDGMPIEDDDVIVVDEGMSILQKTKVDDTSRQDRNGMELLQQKAALIEEVQRLNRESNMKREVVLRLVGLLRAMDPLFLETKEKAEITRKKLYGMKRGIKDDDNMRRMFMAIGLEGNEFFEIGSKIKKDTHKNIINNLKTKDLDYSRDISHRSLGYGTKMARYRDSLRPKIFGEKELFKKTRIGKNDKLQQDFNNMNDGIDQDKLNPSRYPTRRLEGENRENDVQLDNEISEIYGDGEGANEKFDQLLNKLGKENLNLNLEDIKAKKANPRLWDRPFEYLPESEITAEPENSKQPEIMEQSKIPIADDEIEIIDDIDPNQSAELLNMDSDNDDPKTENKAAETASLDKTKTQPVAEPSKEIVQPKAESKQSALEQPKESATPPPLPLPPAQEEKPLEEKKHIPPPPPLPIETKPQSIPPPPPLSSDPKPKEVKELIAPPPPPLPKQEPKPQTTQAPPPPPPLPKQEPKPQTTQAPPPPPPLPKVEPKPQTTQAPLIPPPLPKQEPKKDNPVPPPPPAQEEAKKKEMSPPAEQSNRDGTLEGLLSAQSPSEFLEQLEKYSKDK